jgi:hypothetical protein
MWWSSATTRPASAQIRSGASWNRATVCPGVSSPGTSASRSTATAHRPQGSSDSAARCPWPSIGELTHFRQSPDGANWADLVLCTAPASTPAKTFDPYLGDYDHLVTVGRDFYGIFSANNTPDNANFPNGVVYQRNADFATHRLLALDGTTPVAPSIDPFFVKVKG